MNHWTDDEIRAVTPFPKPRGALIREWDNAASRTDNDIEPNMLERKLLEHVLEYGDYVRVGASEVCTSGVWLLVPLPWTLIEALEQFEAIKADLEDNGDRESDLVNEPSLGATSAIDQRRAGWGTAQLEHHADIEFDHADRAEGEFDHSSM